MKIGNDMLYGPCPCGSGSKFKFCCWPKYRDRIDGDMTKAEIVQTVRCEAAGVYHRTDNAEADEICERGRQMLVGGDSKKARPLFQKARAIDPKMWIAWNNEAICSWEEGDVEDAYELQRKGIEACEGHNTFGVASMAIFAHVLGRDEEAREWLDRALADKLPLSRDIVAQVCKALALFRRHRDIVDYATMSGMDEDWKVAFFKGVALANLGAFSEALVSLDRGSRHDFGVLSSLYAQDIRAKAFPYSVYDDWPYFCRAWFSPARWFDDDIKAGKDPFARYPNVAVDAIEVLVSDEARTASEMLKLTEGRGGERMEKLRNALKELAESRIVDENGNVVGGLPEGVVEVKDEDRIPILPPMPKWRMEYEISEVNESEDDVNAIMERLVRPYAERHCSIEGHEEIAIMITRLKRGKLPIDCPSIMMGKYAQFWDMLRLKLEELFECLEPGTIICEVKYDQMFGGPMLSIEEENGDVELFSVAMPDHFGEDS